VCSSDGASDVEMFAFSEATPDSVDASFDLVIGHLEEIIMDGGFQEMQRRFMDENYREFEDTEENKLSYTQIFHQYMELIEGYITAQLSARLPGFSMATFVQSLPEHKEEMTGDIFDLLLTFSDFLAFKDMFLDYRA
uniref:ADP-ribosylation factor-like protein 2-binding protein n=1 Tax=Petromyzon marinus TaxID=7757 RepID=A0AAJ7WL48_PETMA